MSILQMHNKVAFLKHSQDSVGPRNPLFRGSKDSILFGGKWPHTHFALAIAGGTIKCSYQSNFPVHGNERAEEERSGTNKQHCSQGNKKGFGHVFFINFFICLISSFTQQGKRASHRLEITQLKTYRWSFHVKNVNYSDYDEVPPAPN